MWSTQGQWVASEVHHTHPAMHSAPCLIVRNRGTHPFRSVSCSWWLKAVRKQESGHLWEDRENSTLLMRNITYVDSIGVKENSESKINIRRSRTPLTYARVMIYVYMLSDSEVSLEEQHTIDDNQWHDVSTQKSLSPTYKSSCKPLAKTFGSKCPAIEHHHFACQVTFCYQYQHNHVPLQHHAGWCYNCWQDILWRAVWKCTMYEDVHNLSLINSHYRTSLCELGPRDPTKNLTSMVPKDQMSVLREIHSGRTSLQDMGKDVWRWGEGGGGETS